MPPCVKVCRELTPERVVVKLFRNRYVWLVLLVLLVLVRVTDLQHSRRAIILLSGILVSFAPTVLVMVLSKRVNYRARTGFVAPIFTAVLLAGLWHRGSTGKIYQYHDNYRWSGIWDNPNTCGELVGVGFIVASSLLLQSCRRILFWKHNNGSDGGTSVKAEEMQTRLNLGFYSIATGALAFGLLDTYSRAAWLGTGAGFGYLMVQWFRVCGFGSRADMHSSESKVHNRGALWISRNWQVGAVIAISLIILAFWQFRFTEWGPGQRVFSMANINDFSWRNRVMAWKASVRMMVDRPWIGFGWGEVALASQDYCPPPLNGGLPIELNDYFMLGISAGVPALVCFLIYVGLSLRSSHSLGRAVGGEDNGHRQGVRPGLEWTQTVCRAGVIVLMVGFWFDGGLFELATGSVFWILLELGRREPRIDTKGHESGSIKEQGNEVENPKPICLRPTTARQALQAREKGGSGQPPSLTAPARPGGSDTPCKRGRTDVWFRRLASVVASLALVQTSVLVGMPFLQVSTATLGIARLWLIPPRAVADLDFLANGSSLRNQKLRILLQHASLANYNRQLINWKLDDQIYRDYVLTPGIDPERDGRLNWRRALWEYFYPPVRKENTPQAAAEIVVKLLRQRITITPREPQLSQAESSARPLTIDEMWRQGQADAKGFEALKVAVFRSVGIPARLNESGQAELFADGKWNVARET